eukprot:12898735-Prorocentrum_lima.AAC.1
MVPLSLVFGVEKGCAREVGRGDVRCTITCWGRQAWDSAVPVPLPLGGRRRQTGRQTGARQAGTHTGS